MSIEETAVPALFIGGNQNVRLAAARKIAGPIHPADELLLLQPPSGSRGGFSLAQIREVLRISQLSPFGTRRLIYLETDFLSALAQQTLLKFLEEGALHNVTVLGSSTGQQILPTLRSRCHIHVFPPVTIALQETDPLEQEIGEAVTRGRKLLSQALTSSDRQLLRQAVSLLSIVTTVQQMKESALPSRIVADYLRIASGVRQD